jgi:putative nucleotidyltransferase with HDIG domain
LGTLIRRRITLQNIGNFNRLTEGQGSPTDSGSSSGAEIAARSIEDLPAMPHIAAQILQKVANPDSTHQEIHELITKDQSLAARVLKVANSPYYGASRSISSVKEAILFMGFDSIRSLVTAAVMKNLCSAVSDTGRQLWEHSICCAVAAKQIAVDIGLQGSEQAFLAGLIHDIGKSVLFLQAPDKMREIVLLVNGGKSFGEAEWQLLGFTHAEVGRLLTIKWLFSLTIEDVIANHHKPDCARLARELSHTVSLADSLCHKLGIGLTKRPELDPYELESSRELGLGPSAISSTLELLAETISIEGKS